MGLNDGFDYREQIGPGADGEPLLTYLSRRWCHSSRAEWRHRIRSGQILVDSQPSRPEARLRLGQSVTWRRPAWNEPEAPESIQLLFEDDEMLAVVKPAGLPTLPGGGFLRSTLLHLVRQRLAHDASPVHRLGRWTSGVVLFARTRAARAELSRQWATRAVVKRYRALASGVPAETEFSVTCPIGPVPYPPLGTVHAASPRGKPASSRVLVLERRAGAFVCDVVISTGRPHQIRIHLAAAGHPLVGDPLYASGGVPHPGCRAVPGDPGYHLHAAELTLRHPRTAHELRLASEPPQRLRSGS